MEAPTPIKTEIPRGTIKRFLFLHFKINSCAYRTHSNAYERIQYLQMHMNAYERNRSRSHVTKDPCHIYNHFTHTHIHIHTYTLTSHYKSSTHNSSETFNITLTIHPTNYTPKISSLQKQVTTTKAPQLSQQVTITTHNSSKSYQQLIIIIVI